jgi:hypothetical protein
VTLRKPTRLTRSLTALARNAAHVRCLVAWQQSLGLGLCRSPTVLAARVAIVVDELVHLLVRRALLLLVHPSYSCAERLGFARTAQSDGCFGFGTTGRLLVSNTSRKTAARSRG